jgi:L-threonylcarbamoyladenylate synthase
MNSDAHIKQEINRAIATLKKGGLILYPTDTIWGIGCDATNAEAIDRVYALKKRPDAKALICMVSDFKMLNQYVSDIPEVAYDILKYAVKPTTIIYDKPIRVAQNLLPEDESLAVRVSRHDYSKQLIRKFKRPIVSTSANISGQPSPNYFQEIDPAILAGVDYIVNLERKKKNGAPSAIIKLKNDGTVHIIRD